jgi:predicted anti-sigma-YlaC factor YlaD
MTDRVGREQKISCREARRQFGALDQHDAASTDVSLIDRHVQTCSRCALEYRLFTLQRAALDAAAVAEPITPDEDFFRGLRARIARGPEPSVSRPQDESWAAALLITARQLLPAMAVLVLLMVGLTLLWNQPAETNQITSQAAVRPRERVVFPDMYDYPEPTQSDVLETLVVVEEQENGK